MSNTVFTDYSTLIVASWLNDVNSVVYNVLGDGINVPTSAAQLKSNLGIIDLPVQTGNANKLLVTNGTNLSWSLLSLSGTSISGILGIANGGTGASDAATARTNLGLGTAAVNNVGTSANNVVQLDGSAKLPAIDGSQLTNLPSSRQIQSISASVATNALTLTYNGGTLDFRDSLLTNGTPVQGVAVPSLSITVPSGSTLGTINSQQAQLVLIIAYNNGTPVACISNMAGGVKLDETGLISPTTISGSSNSSSVIYSASTVAANSPYRVVGFVDITQATAGVWATAPSTIQGAGGNAMQGLMTLGHGQVWQNVSGSRAYGTTYYNTTARPIAVSVSNANATAGGDYLEVFVGGVSITRTVSNGATYTNAINFIVPPGSSYRVTNASAGTISLWAELR